MSNEIIIALIITIPPTITSLVAVYLAVKSNKAIKEVHLVMNSRLDQLLKSSNAEARAEGKEEGRNEK